MKKLAVKSILILGIGYGAYKIIKGNNREIITDPSGRFSQANISNAEISTTLSKPIGIWADHLYEWVYNNPKSIYYGSPQDRNYFKEQWSNQTWEIAFQSFGDSNQTVESFMKLVTGFEKTNVTWSDMIKRSFQTNIIKPVTNIFKSDTPKISTQINVTDREVKTLQSNNIGGFADHLYFIVKDYNLYSGQLEERMEFINLWKDKTWPLAYKVYGSSISNSSDEFMRLVTGINKSLGNYNPFPRNPNEYQQKILPAKYIATYNPNTKMVGRMPENLWRFMKNQGFDPGLLNVWILSWRKQNMGQVYNHVKKYINISKENFFKEIS